MKRLILTLSIVLLAQLVIFSQNQPVYFQVGTSSESMESVAGTVRSALENSGFRIIGEYNPANSDSLYAICYTRKDLEEIALSFAERGALASALKIGLKKNDDYLKISMINPMYLFYGYFIDGIDKKESALLKISEDAKSALKDVGSEFKPFGGELSKEKLQKYHYKVMMPYFKDAEELNEFDSFEEGLKVIRGNLEKGKGNTKNVYELVYADKKVAVFGVGLLNVEDGESQFLPIIGEDHIAAMPYEIILQGNEATILPGRFRIALHWPELTMGTFMKIMSTPGDIKNTLQGLTE